jgi:hypothetical protein
MHSYFRAALLLVTLGCFAIAGCGGGTADEGVPEDLTPAVSPEQMKVQMSKPKGPLPKGSPTGEAAK